MSKNKDSKNHAEVNYNQITDNIFIGTNFCCMTHFDEELMSKGIEVDISLEDSRVDSPFGVEGYLWIPVEDNVPPTPYQFEIGTSMIKKSIDDGKKIYVHCRNGHGRAPTMVSAYFIKYEKLEPEEAIEKIRKKRPEIHIDDSQRQALQKFYKKCRQ